MKISEQELISEAEKTGFRPEIMEKVWHLMAIQKRRLKYPKNPRKTCRRKMATSL
jgi:hypothetical protein